MNKDKIIKLIEALKDHCRSMRCEECQFFSESRSCFRCDLRRFARLFEGSPSMWDIKKIKEVL